VSEERIWTESNWIEPPTYGIEVPSNAAVEVTAE